jgi:Zn-dependent protease
MDLGSILIVFVIVLVSMILHEMAHAYTAYFLGDTTAKDEGRLTPNPLVHIDPWMSIVVPLLLFISGGPIFGGAKPVPIDKRNLKGGAWGMALVALAGPLMNFIIAFVAFLIAHFTGVIYEGSFGSTVFTQIITSNIGFAVFNMIPIPPLDGSRILYAIAPDGIRDFMERMEYSTGLIIVFVMVYFFSNYLSAYLVGAIRGVLTFFFWLVGVQV